MLKLNISGGRVLEQLKLPVPPDEFKRKVDEIRAAGQPNIAPTVLNADSSVPALNWHLQQTRLDSDSTLQKLNQLAETIDGMNAAEHYHLSKSLDPESQQSLDDVLRIAAHIKPASLDCYEVIPGVTSHQELGRWLVEHDRLEDKVPEALRPYLDYRSIGVDYCNSHDGEFLSDGYTGIRSGAAEQVMEEQGVLHLTLSSAKGTFSLSFPASDERLEQAKRALGCDLGNAAIRDVEIGYPWAHLLPRDAITLEDANVLAECVRGMTREELRVFGAVLEVEEPCSFHEAGTIAMDIYDYELVDSSERGYAITALRYAGAGDEILEILEGFTDFDALGRSEMEADGVRETSFGSVKRLSAPWPQQEPELGQTMC